VSNSFRCFDEVIPNGMSFLKSEKPNGAFKFTISEIDSTPVFCKVM